VRKVIGVASATLMLFGSASAQAATLSFGPQTFTYVSEDVSRGYYFTAPTAFTITSLYIPTDASTGAQTVEVIRLEATPPTYEKTTSAFSVLGLYSSQNAADPIQTRISVAQGDVVGILGYRGFNVSSYIDSPQTMLLAGQLTTFTRLASNDTGAGGAVGSVFTENPGTYIGRINFNYTVLSAVPEPTSWAMMIAGFGMAGAALRGQRKAGLRLLLQ
jgi:hypothetical protein